MKKDDQFNKFLGRILKFISFRPRSQKEILNYLEKKIPPKKELKEKLLKEINNLGLIDDREFTRWWIEQRATFRPKGKRALFFELRQKGVERQIIEEVLSGNIDEINLAKQIVDKKWLFLKKLPPQIAKQKILNLLKRRGFSGETIKEVLDEIKRKR